MNFHDLKLPKELSKKKKLDLYKCWILSPLTKGSDQRVLELDWSCDRYGLTEIAAVAIALNSEYGADKLLEHSEDLISFFSSKLFVIMKVTLLAGTMDEEVIVPPENKSNFDTDPHYDPIMSSLYVTIKDRIAESEIKNYALVDVQIDTDPSTNIIYLKDLKLKEQIINHLVTGGK